jgi:hypothetical protein
VLLKVKQSALAKVKLSKSVLLSLLAKALAKALVMRKLSTSLMATVKLS